MEAKPEIVSTDTIKPSSPTPNHLRNFKLSLLDQLAPPSIYVPIVLFYSACYVNAFATDFSTISNKLKTSLSDVLTLYYPLSGRLQDNFSIECNDVGVTYIESKVPTNLHDILKNPQIHKMKEFFPFDPYNPGHNELPAVNMAVQLNQFTCGGIGLGVCFSHKIADGATVGSFLNAWASITRGEDNIVTPQMDVAMLFPQRNIQMNMTRGMTGHQDIVTKRFIFDGANLSMLRDKFGCFNPTRVEAVTTLIWKLAIEAAKVGSEEHIHQATMVSHAVNIRSRMIPSLSKHVVGNLWQQAISPLVEMKGVVGLHDLAEIVRKTVKKVDIDYISKLQGDEFPKVIESLAKARILVAEKGIPCYSFSSWTRFGFYENDFGWGKPEWVCTIGVPIKNVVILMATRDGDGIEAWVTLTEDEMTEFESNPELLLFTSL